MAFVPPLPPSTTHRSSRQIRINQITFQQHRGRDQILALARTPYQAWLEHRSCCAQHSAELSKMAIPIPVLVGVCVVLWTWTLHV